MKYIISDTHFGHDNIIQYCDRPFDSVGEMNREIIEQWNTTVSNEDTVLHLGDVAHGSSRFDESHYLKQLNGDIVVVRGNHDSGIAQNAPSHIVESCVVQHGRYEFYCEHQPVTYSGWQLCGHTHNNDIVNYPFIDGDNKRVNVSAEFLNYQPLLMDELVTLIDDVHRATDLSQARVQYGTTTN